RSESARDDNVAIWLDADRVDVVVHSAQAIQKGGVDTAVGIQPRDIITRYPINRGDVASRNSEFSVGQWDDDARVSVRPKHAVEKCLIETTVGIQAGKPAAVQAVDVQKVAAHEHFPVGQERNEKRGGRVEIVRELRHEVGIDR